MAGDWLQIDLDLPEKWEVGAITDAAQLCHADVALGRLILFWRWVERHASSELVPGARIETLIRNAGGDESFWRAVESVGWVRFTDEGVVIPGWKKRFSKSAKKRALNSRRQRNRRASVAPKRDKSRASASPKEEKNREENIKGVNPLKPPADTFPKILDTPEFREAWSAWERHRKEIGKSLKPTTRAAQLDMLAEKGRDLALATVKNSTAQGYQGLFEPDKTQKDKTRGNSKYASAGQTYDPGARGDI